MPRLINEIAAEIKRDWLKPNYAAKPYLDAMHQLSFIFENYGVEKASTIIAYFLANAGTWRGKTAKRIKLELKNLIK